MPPMWKLYTAVTLQLGLWLALLTAILQLYSQQQHINYVSRQIDPIIRPVTYNQSLADLAKRRYVNELLTDMVQIRDLFQTLIDRRLPATHPDVLGLVRLLLYPPSRHAIKPSIPYRSLIKHYLPDQAQWVIEHFRQKKGGFFVESGGFDGERSSNTLILEQEYGWDGVLIEADPFYFTQILGKNRHCWTINVCLSPTKKLQWLTLEEDTGGQGAILHSGMKPGQRAEDAKKAGINSSLQKHQHPILNNIPCLPLESILRALNRTSVDYLSLDVEGMEMAILESFPHEDIRIESMTVEYNHASSNEEEKNEMRHKITEMGYTYVKEIFVVKPELSMWSRDFVFVKKNTTQ